MANMYKRIKNDPRITKKRTHPASESILGIKNFVAHRGRNPWRVNLTKKRTPWARILAPILIVAIPVLVMMAASNTLMRLPDVYKYHLLSSEVLSERMISADETDVSKLISNYMVHKTDTFQMKENLDYMPDNLFTKADGDIMFGIRRMTDLQLVLGLAMMVLAAAVIVYLVRKREKDILLRDFYLCLPVYAFLQIANAVILLFSPIRNRVFGIVADKGDGNLLPAILDGSYFRLLVLTELVLSLVFLGLIYYLVLNLSGRKTTFGR